MTTSRETGVVREGDAAPPFSLPTGDGNEVSLEELRGRTVVLFFYPKDMTPGCTTEACDFRDRHASILASGAVVLGVSPDGPERHRKFSEKHSLPFPLLCDETHTTCEAYGVWKEKSLYGKKYMGVERSTFVIDADGTVRKAFRKVKVAGHVEQVLALLAD